ncbi:MAG: gephyrin-like molybdotransferase Glp [Solirubrobacterales bacterium]
MPELIEIDEARRLVLQSTAPLGPEPVELREALGRVLAEPITSATAVPAFDNSAMDGYAVRAADTDGATSEAPRELEVVAESRAGAPAGSGLEPGQAIAISTGAVIPDGADAVVQVERTDGGRERVAVRAEVAAGANIRRAGEDIAAGDQVLEAGAELGPAEIGVLASVDRPRIACWRRPRVTVLTTGDELLEPGEPLRPGAVRNSNSYSVGALVERSGAVLSGTEIVADDERITEEALGRALASNVTIVCGGVSVGPHDHVRPALERLGVEQLFWGVALRPGKPTWFGVAPRNPAAGPGRSLVFGLPGNPVSSIVTFLLFARPAIRAMLGANPGGQRRATAILDQDYSKQPGRAHLIRVRLELADDGWHATPTGDQGSHVLTSMLGADALAIIPTDAGDVSAGERVEFEPLP